jgi:hypothetical protein
VAGRGAPGWAGGGGGPNPSKVRDAPAPSEPTQSSGIVSSFLQKNRRRFTKSITVSAILLLVAVFVIAYVISWGIQFVKDFQNEKSQPLGFEKITTAIENNDCPDITQTELDTAIGHEVQYLHTETCHLAKNDTLDNVTVKKQVEDWMEHIRRILYTHSFEFNSPRSPSGKTISTVDVETPIVATRPAIEGCGIETDEEGKKQSIICPPTIPSNGIVYIRGEKYDAIELPLTNYGYTALIDYSVVITIYRVKEGVTISDIRTTYIDEDLNDAEKPQQPYYFISRDSQYIVKVDHGNYRWDFSNNSSFADRELQGFTDIVNEI